MGGGGDINNNNLEKYKYRPLDQWVRRRKAEDKGSECTLEIYTGSSQSFRRLSTFIIPSLTNSNSHSLSLSLSVSASCIIRDQLPQIHGLVPHGVSKFMIYSKRFKVTRELSQASQWHRELIWNGLLKWSLAIPLQSLQKGRITAKGYFGQSPSHGIYYASSVNHLVYWIYSL